MDPGDPNYARYHGDSRFEDSIYYNYKCIWVHTPPSIVLAISNISNFYEFAKYLEYCLKECRRDTGAIVEWRGAIDWIQIIVWTDDQATKCYRNVAGWRVTYLTDRDNTISTVTDWFIRYVSSCMAKL